MTPTDRQLFDLAAFATAHVASKDIDPAYPVIRWIEDGMELDEDSKVWHTLVYVAWYNLGSAVSIWLEPERITDFLPPGAPTGIERRGFRTAAKMQRHLDSLTELSDLHDGYGQWIAAAGVTWQGATQMLQQAWGNGRWAAYKTCELLNVVHGWPITASDMGNEDSTGPVAGLELMYGTLKTVAEQDSAAWDLKMRLYDRGVNLPWEQLETVLCDFHAMAEGRYYVGHDIDQMQAQAEKAPDPVRDLIMEARKATLPHEYLGELNGWSGVDLQRRVSYAATGSVIVRA